MTRLWLCLISICSVISHTKLSDIPFESNPNAGTSQNNMIVVSKREYESFNKGEEKRPTFSKWSPWSECAGGQQTRRRHCQRRRICGDSLRVEVASCKDGENRLSERASKKTENENIFSTRTRQLHSDEVQKRFLGFSPWSGWTDCSRRCSTMRKRHCMRRDICGRQVVRQSAYCYMEGTYCQQWIRAKMQRRKDPAGHTVRQTMKTPALAIHREDTQTVSTKAVHNMMASCGKLGRYRGSEAARLRGRMREMVRIIGGRPAPPGKWPWQVAVLNRYKVTITGSPRPRPRRRLPAAAVPTASTARVLRHPRLGKEKSHRCAWHQNIARGAGVHNPARCMPSFVLAVRDNGRHGVRGARPTRLLRRRLGRAVALQGSEHAVLLAGNHEFWRWLRQAREVRNLHADCGIRGLDEKCNGQCVL